ncbi:MAG TPA: divalent-cation tolerance protein CutA [Candidatus Ozemobacteraceae bacterium]|nr:divalent-cation tolerance protein CutA [Candidatus Ozemobacteraceae bacterium]
MDKKIMLVTVPDRESGGRIADALLAGKLAACVSILPGVESRYVWEGRIETGNELLLLIKTRADLLEAVQAKVSELHPYEVPEILALPIEFGALPYLRWMDDVFGPPGGVA